MSGGDGKITISSVPVPEVMPREHDKTIDAKSNKTRVFRVIFFFVLAKQLVICFMTGSRMIQYPCNRKKGRKFSALFSIRVKTNIFLLFIFLD